VVLSLFVCPERSTCWVIVGGLYMVMDHGVSISGVFDASVYVLCISCIVYFHIVCTSACRQLAQDDVGICMVCTHLGR
jgi:hypothetical protein